MSNLEWKIGDCQDLMQEMKPDSVDLIVTDPPYFMVNNSGSGFMGKSWDSINTNKGYDILCKSKEFAQFVTRFFISMRVDSNTDVENTVQSNVNASEHHHHQTSNASVQSVEKNLSDINHKLKVNMSSVRGLVLTKDDLLDLLSELSLNHTNVSQEIPDSALFAVPSSYIINLLTDIVQENVLKLPTSLVCSEIKTHLTSMDEVRINGIIEGMIGSRLGYKSTNEINTDVKSADITVKGKKFRHITSSSIERRKTIHWIIWLLYVLNVIQTLNTTQKSFIKKDLIYDLIQKFHTNWMSESYRVLKPGAFAFIMSAPRQDILLQMIKSASDAGFETGFTSIYWTFASGFPKAGNIGKMVDKRYKHELKNNEAKALDGSYGGFQPKPAVEIIMVVMKPLSESTYVDQAIKNQHGITWLDDGRIPFNSENEINIRLNVKNHATNKAAGIECFNKIGNENRSYNKNRNELTQDLGFHNSQGRFPANLLVCDDVLNDGKEKRGGITNYQASSIFNNGLKREKKDIWMEDSGSFSRYFDLDAWFNKKNLPEEVQKTFPFMITPKANKSEKNKGFTGNKKQGGSMSGNQGKTMDLGEASLKQKPKQIQPVINNHPTVKPVKLFSWLMTIGSREGDLVLDPFLGSGTALEAGYLINRDVLGFELDPQWEKLYENRAHTYQKCLEEWI